MRLDAEQIRPSGAFVAHLNSRRPYIRSTSLYIDERITMFDTADICDQSRPVKGRCSANFAFPADHAKVAGKGGHSLPELADGWNATQLENSSVISRATGPHQVEQNAKDERISALVEELSVAAS